MAFPQIETGYKPEFGLGALYQGYNAANADTMAQEDIIKQYLANQREQQMAPLDVQIKGLEAAQSNALNTPENLQQFVLGKIGSQQQQQALGTTAMAEVPQKVAKSGLMSRFVDFQNKATDTSLPEETRLFARKQAQDIGTMLAETDPSNVAKLEQLQLKQKLQGMKPSDVTALMNWASKTGTPLSTAIDLFKSGQGQFSGDQLVSSPNTQQQTSVQQGQNSFGFQEGNLSLEDKMTVDKVLSDGASGKIPYSEVQNKLLEISKRYPSGLQNFVPPSDSSILDKTFANKSSNATVAERAANLTGSFVQTANDVKNLVESPAGSELGIFSGLNGKDRDTVITSLSAFMGRKLTPEQDRALQMAVSGFKVTMASVIGGGFATASSKARMDALADQLPREGDPPSAKLIWLARVKQELEAASETFETRESANKEQKQIVKNKMQDINRLIPWDFADVNSALRKKSGQATTGEAGQATYGGAQSQYKAGDTKVIGGVTYTRNEQGTWDKK